MSHPSEATTEVLTTETDIVWQWSYEDSVDKLARLYRMAKRDQWNPDDTINWSLPVDPSNDILEPERLPFRTTKLWGKLSRSQQELFSAHNAAYMLSQFLHGEQGALMVASALVHAVPDYDAKLYVATQAMDEARHVEVFKRYIDRIGIVYPVDQNLKRVLDQTLTQRSWVAMLIGMQLIVEGLALGSFMNMQKATTEPLFRDLLTYVLKDESRHVACGSIYARRALEAMETEAREPLEDFALEAVLLMRKARLSNQKAGDLGVYGTVMENAGIDPLDFMKAMALEYAGGWRPKALPGQVHTFKDLMMPQLVRVGLVQTERIQDKYRQAQVTMFDDTSVLASFEAQVLAN